MTVEMVSELLGEWMMIRLLNILKVLKKPMDWTCISYIGKRILYHLSHQGNPIYLYFYLFTYLYAVPCGIHMGSLFPKHGLNPGPRQWKRRVLTMGLSGKYLSLFQALWGDHFWFWETENMIAWYICLELKILTVHWQVFNSLICSGIWWKFTGLPVTPLPSF